MGASEKGQGMRDCGGGCSELNWLIREGCDPEAEENLADLPARFYNPGSPMPLVDRQIHTCTTTTWRPKSFSSCFIENALCGA